MTEQLTLYILPYWIQTVLLQNRIPYADFGDFEKIRNVFSPNDLLDACGLQKVMGDVLGYHDFGSLTGLWYSHNNWRGATPEVEMLSKLEDNGEHAATVAARLFNDSALVLEYKSKFSSGEDKPYDVVSMGGNRMAIFLKPCNLADLSSRDGRLALCREILKTSYVYVEHNVVVKSALTRVYLDLL